MWAEWGAITSRRQSAGRATASSDAPPASCCYRQLFNHRLTPHQPAQSSSTASRRRSNHIRYAPDWRPQAGSLTFELGTSLSKCTRVASSVVFISRRHGEARREYLRALSGSLRAGRLICVSSLARHAGQLDSNRVKTVRCLQFGIDSILNSPYLSI